MVLWCVHKTNIKIVVVFLMGSHIKDDIVFLLLTASKSHNVSCDPRRVFPCFFFLLCVLILRTEIWENYALFFQFAGKIYWIIINFLCCTYALYDTVMAYDS